MIIRKQFKFEGAHIVRNCSSIRCKQSIHGHSYVVEVFFSADGLDNGQMVMDFGLMKHTIGEFIDSFDHTYTAWNRETEEFKTFMVANSSRYIEMPVSPSAEALSLMFLFVLDKIVKNTEFNNGEKGVHIKSVRVHETLTGYAESFQEDLVYFPYDLQQIFISEEIKSEWKDPEMWDKLVQGIPFVNPVVTQQV
jgi:6-pyruvoyltetrahydropterin/6-carboxytetrahydropterin synthase